MMATAMTAHEKDMIELKSILDKAEAKGIAQKRPGCFGGLGFDAKSMVCMACPYSGDCMGKADAEKIENLIKLNYHCAELATVADVVGLEDEELEPERSPMVPMEAETVAETEIMEAADASEFVPEGIDIEALKIKNKKRPINWDNIINHIFAIRPITYGDLIDLMKNDLAEVDMPKGNVYDYTKRMAHGLIKQGAIEWDGGKESTIFWRV